MTVVNYESSTVDITSLKGELDGANIQNVSEHLYFSQEKATLRESQTRVGVKGLEFVLY